MLLNIKVICQKKVMEMEARDKLCQEVPKQLVDVKGVSLVHVEHYLVNSLHNCKERLTITQHMVFNLIV